MPAARHGGSCADSYSPGLCRRLKGRGRRLREETLVGEEGPERARTLCSRGRGAGAETILRPAGPGAQEKKTARCGKLAPRMKEGGREGGREDGGGGFRELHSSVECTRTDANRWALNSERKNGCPPEQETLAL